MTAYVADWSQEVYGDWRRVAVPGTSIAAAPRPPERLPPAPGRPRPGRAARDRARPDASSRRPTARWPTQPGRGTRATAGRRSRPTRCSRSSPSRSTRCASFSVVDRPAAGSLGLRLGAAQRRPRERRLRHPVPRRSSTGSRRRSATPAGRPNPADPGIEACTGSCTGDLPGAIVHARSGSRSGRGRSRCSPSRARRRRSRPARRPGRSSLALLNATGAVAAGTVPDHDHAALELAARPVLARADRPVDADARPLDPRGRKRGRAVLLPRHQGGQRRRSPPPPSV